MLYLIPLVSVQLCPSKTVYLLGIIDDHPDSDFTLNKQNLQFVGFFLTEKVTYIGPMPCRDSWAIMISYFDSDH